MPVGVTTATFAFDNMQVTKQATLLVVPSLNSAKAVNCVKPPYSRFVAAGDIRNEVAVALVTVSCGSSCRQRVL